MAAQGKLVYVLGAGFTRAFVPRAPLLVDDFDAPQLLKQFASFPNAESVLQDALKEYPDGKIDLEKLMTRLTGMPYDRDDASRELVLLATRLRRILIAKFDVARAAAIDVAGLHAFARRVIGEQASIVTFNYDDVLDEALYMVARGIDGGQYTWHPDGGYGFYCRPSLITVADTLTYMNLSRTLLLKLHGSFNWRSPLGEPTSRSPGGICHHESWFAEDAPNSAVTSEILALRDGYLEPDPLIIPPVLVKSELMLHPVLRLVWGRAREKLLEAERVIFIGYSLPITDLASRTLFEETLVSRPKCEIHVVNKAGGEREGRVIEVAYRHLFLGREMQFHMDGAREWLRRVAPEDPANKSAEAGGSAAASVA